MQRRLISTYWIIALPIFLVFLFAPKSLFAATLYFSPAGGTYHIGQTISASILVSSTDQAMNAASGVVSFPRDILEATSISKSGSIINLWAEEPKFSNANGTVSFEGVVLSPGYTGGAGRIITVYFKVRAIGNAELLFSSASVLANDGRGTNILSSSGKASYNLDSTPLVPEKVPTPTTVPKETTKTPVATSTSSTTPPVLASSTPVLSTEEPDTPFITFSKAATKMLSVIIPLTALVILLILLCYYGLTRYYGFKKRALKASMEAEGATNKAFKLLKESVSSQIRKLERTQSNRKLTEVELEFLDQLKLDLSEAEEYIKKEIQDVERLK